MPLIVFNFNNILITKLDSSSRINIDSFLIFQNLQSMSEKVDDLEPRQIFTDDNWADSGKKKKSKAGMIAGILIGVIHAVAIVVIVVVIVLKKCGSLGDRTT